MGWWWAASCPNPGQPSLRFPKRRTPSPRLIRPRRRLDEKPTSERHPRPRQGSFAPCTPSLNRGNGGFTRQQAKGKRRFLGSPQTPSGELRPLHPLFESWARRVHSAASKRKEKVSGAPSHCPPDSVPQTPSGELRPLHPLLMSGSQSIFIGVFLYYQGVIAGSGPVLV